MSAFSREKKVILTDGLEIDDRNRVAYSQRTKRGDSDSAVFNAQGVYPR